MKKYETVKQSTEFNDIIKNGKYLKNEHFVIYYVDSNEEFPKFGLAVSKKCGNAVVRNKIKRQLRDLISRHKKLFSNTKNYIIMVRRGINEISFKIMEESFILLLTKGKIK